MRLLLMGTGPFCLPGFRALAQSRHELLGVVTSWPTTVRSRTFVPARGVRKFASQHGLPLFEPENVNTPEWQNRLAAMKPDILVVCDYGRILSPATLAVAAHGGVNLHASLLPKYRGAAPINWAIYHGERETGVTVTLMTPQIDAGPCIAQARLDILPDETAAELEPRLAELGARVLCEAIDLLESGRAKPWPQDPALATRAPRLKKSDGLIDWSRSAEAIKNHVRAMEPWPRTFTFWHPAHGRPLRVILGPVKIVPQADLQGLPHPPGSVIEAEGKRLLIAAGEGALVPQSIQPANKRMMTIDEFLRGYHVQRGERFGPPA